MAMTAYQFCVRTCLATLLGCSTLSVHGQSTASREELQQPVLRVGETPNPAPIGARPILDTNPQPASDAAAGVATSKESAPQETIVAALAPSSAPRLQPDPAISEPQRLLNEAVANAVLSIQQSQANIHDYTCLLIKREMVHGEVLPSEFIETKIRNRKVKDGQVVVPFAVYMKFVKPASMRGREVLFVEGAYNNQVRVKEGGTRGKFLPSVLLSPTGRLALQGNRYPIYEVGVENMAQRLIDRATDDTEIDVCDVCFRSGAKIDGRPCKFMQVKRSVPKQGDAAKRGMNVYLAQVFFDEELNVPIRYAAYDWPQGQGERPEVIEEYTYQDLKINVGLTDRDFDYQNPEYNF